MKVFDALADALVAEGARCVFCVMGDGNLDLLNALADRGVQLVHARHEQNAVAMADGYASAGGFPALCSVTHGPGLTQTATSLAVARSRRSPLLLLAGDTPAANRQHVQNFPQEPFIVATGASLVNLRAPATVAEDVCLAVDQLRSGPGPIVLNMPTDVQLADLPRPGSWQYTPGAPKPVSAPDPVSLDDAAELFVHAERPVILAGRGSVLAQASPAIATLASLLEAPIVTTLWARGLLAGHPLSAGVSGGLGAAVASELLRDADCILALGTSLSGFTTAHGRALEETALILVDADVASHPSARAATVVLQGDVGLAVSGLQERIAATGLRREPDLALRARIAQTPPLAPFDDGEQTVDPRRAMTALDACLPADRFVVTDGGHFGGWACAYLHTPDPTAFIFAPAFGCVGQGLGVSIGAAFARPGQRVTLVAGDGGFLMSMQELETAARYRVPLTIVIINDEAYGQEFHSLAAKGLPTHEALVGTPELARLADSVGVAGHRVAAPGDLASLPEWLEGADGPLLIDVRVNRDLISPGSEEIFAAVRRGITAPDGS